MKRSKLKVPFKLNLFLLKIETEITPFSFIQMIVLTILCMVFLLALIIYLRGYLIGLTISGILDRTIKSKYWSIFKTRSP
jgi:hypothetical protein